MYRYTNVHCCTYSVIRLTLLHLHHHTSDQHKHTHAHTLTPSHIPPTHTYTITHSTNTHTHTHTITHSTNTHTHTHTITHSHHHTLTHSHHHTLTLVVRIPLHVPPVISVTGLRITSHLQLFPSPAASPRENKLKVIHILIVWREGLGGAWVRG